MPFSGLESWGSDATIGHLRRTSLASSAVTRPGDASDGSAAAAHALPPDGGAAVASDPASAASQASSPRALARRPPQLLQPPSGNGALPRRPSGDGASLPSSPITVGKQRVARSGRAFGYQSSRNTSSETVSEDASPIMSPSIRRHAGQLQQLRDADVFTKTDELGSTPLHWAARWDRGAAVDTLLARGSDPNMARKDGATPLHLAALKGHTDALAKLLAAAAHINATDADGHTPLHKAALRGHAAAVSLLLARGANIDVADRVDGSSPLHLASQMGRLETVRMLLDSGANMHAANARDGFTPLHMAAFEGHLSTVALLIERGANVGAFDVKGSTALNLAIDGRSAPVARLLIGCGAKTRPGYERPEWVQALDRQAERAAELASAAATPGQAGLIKQLLAHDDVELSFLVDGLTAMHVALDAKQWDNLEMLMRHSSAVAASTLRFGVRAHRTSLVDEVALAVASDPVLAPLADAMKARSLEDFERIEDAFQSSGLLRVYARTQTSWCQYVSSASSARIGPLMWLSAAGVELRRDPNGTLVHVDLSNRGLETLPLALGKLHDGVQLNVKGNPLSSVPMDVTRAGSRALLEYLRDVAKTGRVQWRRAKVIVLGREGVGKSHILHRMRHGAQSKVVPYSDLSTNGVNVCDVRVGNMELTWFDFAGQEVFYPTHQFFLTLHCVYMVVFRLDDAQCAERLQHWLQTIAQFARDPRRPVKVVVVATHADIVKSERERAAVWARLDPLLSNNPHAVQLVTVSCTTGKGFDELEAALARAVELCGLGRADVPHHYVSVWQWMCAHRATLPQLEWADFRARFVGLTDIQLEGACRFLADAGQCFYSKPEDLALVVLDLQWLADMFKAIISFYSGVKDGIVTRDRLRLVWKGASDAVIVRNMALLERFEMAFPRVTDGSWVVPSMLKEMAPAAALRRNAAMQRSFERVYVLDVMPAGLMGRLIVRLQELHVLQLRVVDMWRTGVLYEAADGGESGIAFLELAADGVSTQLVVRCVVRLETQLHRRLLYQTVTDECTSLLNSIFFKDDTAPYRELITCPHCLRDNTAGSGALVRLPKQQCIDYVLASEPAFVCGTTAVPTSMLGVDITFGGVRVLDESEVDVELPFAAGGFGLVSRGRWNGTVVAVKELNPRKARLFAAERRGQASQGPVEMDGADATVAALSKGFAEFQHEAALMSRLAHPNIVCLHGIMMAPLRLVMELCGGGDLYCCIESGRLWAGHAPDAAPPPMVAKVALDVARGMAFLHAQQPPVAHRDLRSPNVFLVSLDVAADVCAKVADFGLSVVVTARQRDTLASWQWMAPEAQLGMNYSHQCDLYSFAMVVVEMVTQRVPFAEYEAVMPAIQIPRAIVGRHLRPTLPAALPPWMHKMIEELWQLDAARRPSFTECARRIERADSTSRGSAAEATLTASSLSSPRHSLLNSISPRSPPLTVPSIVRVVFEQQPSEVRCISSNASEVWLGQRNGAVRAFSSSRLLETRKEKHSERAQVLSVCSIGADCALSGASDGTLRLWPSSDPATTTVAPATSSASHSPATTPLGRRKVVTAPISKRFSVRGSVVEADVTHLLLLQDVVLQGSPAGTLTVLTLDGRSLASHTLREPISCMCVVSERYRTAWVGAGVCLYRVEWTRACALEVHLLRKEVHGRSLLQDVVYAGPGRVWSTTFLGDVRVWDTAACDPVGAPLQLNTRVHCLCAVTMRNRGTVWAGCDDEIRVLDARTQSLRAVLALPHPGEVTCMAAAGFDVVWAGVSHESDLGSLYVCDVSQ